LNPTHRTGFPDRSRYDRDRRALAWRSRGDLPESRLSRYFAESGALLSFGPNLQVAWRQIGSHAARILNGARPEDLPVMTPATFDLVVNASTAKDLGLSLSPSLLVSATEVIE
jgi:putative tryptophan/tyrosine transport system substrate-binding protein